MPQKKGEPGSETWPNEEAMKHGGGMTWQPVTYDPELNLIYVDTGNPQPVIAHKNRAGDNLFTGSIVALNPDTGKMAWYFQSSPHDTHDWDSTQTPVLIDGEINGQPRKLLAQAARNGHFFLLDRTTGKALVSSEYVKTNWANGYDAKGQPIPEPGQGSADRRRAGLARTRAARPTGRRRASARRPGCSTSAPGARYSVYYIYDPSDNPQGWGGTDRGGYAGVDAPGDRLQDRQGQVEPQVGGQRPRSGVLSTAGNVLFTGGPSSDLVALNATTGDALWHARLERAGQQRTDHLRARWHAVRGRRRGRYVVDVRDEREEIDAGLADPGVRGARHESEPNESASRAPASPGSPAPVGVIPP